MTHPIDVCSLLVRACALCVSLLLPGAGLAGERVYSVAGQAVRVDDLQGPEGAPAPVLVAIVVATQHGLEATLREARFDDLDPVCDTVGTAWTLAGAAPDYVGDRVVPLAARWDYVALWRLPGSAMGLPLWAVFASAESGPAEGPGACTLVRDDVLALLNDGIARTHVATPRSAKISAVPWIELRHSAGELAELMLPPSFAMSSDDDWNMEERNAGACQMSVYLPPPLPLPGPVVDTLIWRDNAVNKQVALTFDACSTFTQGDYNPAVIDALIANQIPATLFIGGHWAEMHPKEVQWLAAQPWFELGNHTYSHPHMVQLSPELQRQELLWTNQIIYRLTGRLPKYWRPPYGEVDDTLIRTAASVGLYTVEFDLPAGDADYNVSDARLIDWIVSKASSGTIVVMHMNRPGNKTAEVLPTIAQALRAKGYVFSKIGDMLASGHTL